MRVGIYPGSFNPPTIAHLAVSEAARAQRGLDRVVWSVSTKALAKEAVERPLLDHRIQVLHDVAKTHDWLDIQVTQRQLLADIADGFHTVIMGADKWEQIQDVRWYGSETAKTSAFERLPSIAVAPRPPTSVPEELLLSLDDAHGDVSSSAARSGATHLMLAAARSFADRSGAWIDAERYERFCAGSS